MEGNILLGPSAHFIHEKGDKSTTKIVTEQLKEEAYELMPQLKGLSFIRSFSGIRPKLVDPEGHEKFKDFVIEESMEAPGLINLIGIESPGLTSSPAIAEFVVNMITKKERCELNNTLIHPSGKDKRFADMNDEEREMAVAGDSRWGEMICRCESVTRKEVEDALENPLGVKTLDGIKRRSRCGMGRCQGGFCTPRIVELIHYHDNSELEITKRGQGSPLFYGRCK